MRRLAPAPLLVLLTLAGACSAGTAPPPGSGTRPRAASEGLVVEVQNDNPGDFDVFLVRDGFSSRLGLVTGSGFASFEIDRARFSGQGQVGLMARSLSGSTQYTSPTVLVNRGEYLVLTLSPEIRFSQLVVRR